MKEIIKYIRKEASLTQEQFALEIGTTPASINRWENGKAFPTNLAARRILDFVQKNGIDCVSFFLEKYSYLSEKGTVLYHGSKKGIQGEIAPKSREECDFGPGFYMGNNILQALTLICNEENPSLYVIDCDLSDLRIKDVSLDTSWAMLIAYHRGYLEDYKTTKTYKRYASYMDGVDIVKGYIADDRMYSVLSKFFDGTVTDVALLKSLSALDLGVQYVALTPKGCGKIKIIEEHQLNDLELMILRDYATKRRKEGISLAEKIEKEYRRVGEYFDEIIKENG